jgi:hypothetical protein
MSGFGDKKAAVTADAAAAVAAVADLKKIAVLRGPKLLSKSL